MSRASSRSALEAIVDRGLLTIAFVAFAGAVLVAHSSPATGYETSLYTGTPLAFWAMFGGATLLSLLVSLRTAVDRHRRFALGLGGGCAAAFVGLPVLRGYRFYGAGDALTHLGWMRGIQSGSFQPTELIYPALHTITTLLAVTVDIDLSHAAFLVIVLLSCLFFVFVALSTSLVFESRYSTTVGAFSAFLFLPITTLSTYLVPHAMSQAILFASFVLYLLLRYVRSGIPLFTSSALGALLATILGTLVLYHPQLGAHLLAPLFGICLLQYLYRRFRSGHPIAAHRPIYGQTVVLLVAFLAWTSNRGFFVGAVEHATSGVAAFFFGDGAAAESVDSQGASLGELGASLTEMFLKLFGPSLLYIILAGILVLWAAAWPADRLTRETGGTLPYFSVSLIGLAGVFGLYFFGSYGEMYFRVFGLVMLFVTVMGAVAIAYGLSALSRDRLDGVLHGGFTVGFAVLLLLSLIAVFPSPYIYNASPHVTEMSLSGHETAFENQDEGVTFVGIRAGPNRYADAVHAQRERTRGYGAVTGEEIDDGIASQYSEDRYLVVTKADRAREVEAYQGLRYSQAQLDSISSQAGVDRIQSNGEFELYYVRGNAE